MIYAQKINKMPEFYMIFARKNVFPNFFYFFWRGGGANAYAYDYNSNHRHR